MLEQYLPSTQSETFKMGAEPSKTFHFISFHHHHNQHHHHHHHIIIINICHGVGPLVDPFRSHVSISLFKALP